MTKKIGVVTDDGKTISPHFGMAKFYLVFEIGEDGTVKGKEMRPKAWHSHGGNSEHVNDQHSMQHGGSEDSTHGEMLANVRDCEALIARGMGQPMYNAILGKGIRPFLTDIALTDEAVQAYAKGTLDNLSRKLH